MLQTFENNLQISGLGLHNKFDSFEAWEYTKSKRISLAFDKRYKRYPRGSIIKADFGVNVDGKMLLTKDVRPKEYEWIKNLYLEARSINIEFYFRQRGSVFLRRWKKYWKMEFERTD